MALSEEDIKRGEDPVVKAPLSVENENVEKPKEKSKPVTPPAAPATPAKPQGGN